MHNVLLIIGPDLKAHGIGGVTIHVQRLRDFLEKHGFGYKFMDYRNNSLWTLLKGISKTKVVHFHVSNPIYQYILVFFSRLMGKKIIMTLHGNYGRYGSLKNWMVRRTISRATIPIVINEKSFDACIRFNKNTKLIPAFIPPQKIEVLQKEILDLLERLHKEGKRIVSTNAYNVSFDKNGNDTYGVDFLVQYFKECDDKALVISDPSGNYHKRYSTLDCNSVYFIDYPHSYFELLKHVDYFVRNTSTDGDALSVKEALYLNVPTLCSDVVDRPRGVRLFKYCDKASFERCLLENSQEMAKIENGASMILDLYNSIY